ncbi:MAG TPA: hypothetical protein VHU22_04620 [Xanthobacteraceae bacterium]|jgi:hypothetical protein|nr:hypothetical protein [Xanthobacteraceae bacterium]
MTTRQGEQNRSNHKENGDGGRSRSWFAANSAFILSAIAVLALVSTQLVTIGENFPKIFPFWAPFNANISVRDIRVQKAEAVQNRTANATPETAVKLEVEYVEEKTGPSTLKQCLPEIRLQDVYKSMNQPQDIKEETQAKASDTFLIRKNDYSKDAFFQMVCQRRITSWQPLQLPEVEGVNKPVITTYSLCTGEYREACGASANWAPCYTNVENWAKAAHPAECANVQLKQLSDVSGNHCGYATYQITCSTK